MVEVPAEVAIIEEEVEEEEELEDAGDIVMIARDG